MSSQSRRDDNHVIQSLPWSAKEAIKQGAAEAWRSESSDFLEVQERIQGGVSVEIPVGTNQMDKG